MPRSGHEADHGVGQGRSEDRGHRGSLPRSLRARMAPVPRAPAKGQSIGSTKAHKHNHKHNHKQTISKASSPNASTYWWHYDSLTRMQAESFQQQTKHLLIDERGVRPTTRLCSEQVWWVVAGRCDSHSYNKLPSLPAECHNKTPKAPCRRPLRNISAGSSTMAPTTKPGSRHCFNAD
jgi:hypothetical protein